MKLPKLKRKSYLGREHRKSSGDQTVYDSKWRLYSKRYRQTNPFCEVSRNIGKIIDASPGNRKGVVDHIISVHQGGSKWDPRNHMTMCKAVHDKKRSLEARTPILVATLNTPDGLIPMSRQEIINLLNNS